MSSLNDSPLATPPAAITAASTPAHGMAPYKSATNMTMDNRTAPAAAATCASHLQTEAGLSSPSIAAQDSEFALLPRELLDHVASFLPTSAFNNLRLTCKRVENMLFPYWSTVFFKKKQFMFTTFSLQTLVEISRHTTIGPCITHLVFGLDHFTTIPDRFVVTHNDFEQFQYASDLQESLLDTGAALQLLSTAFLNLENLQNIDIRDFNSNTRYRDFIFPANGSRSTVVPAWKSFGHSEVPQWSRFVNDLRGGRLVGAKSHEFINRAFKVILAALGQSASPIRGLEALFRNRESGLMSGAFAVDPILDSTATNLRSVLSGLTKLHLDLDLKHFTVAKTFHYGYHNEDPFKMPTSAREARDPCTTALRRFLILTPNVTWFRFNSIFRTQNQGPRLLSWLALDPEEPFGPDNEAHWDFTNPKPVALPLRRLDLGNINLSSSILGHILQKFGKLESLCFRAVHLRLDSIPHESDDAVGADHYSEWASFIRKLPVFTPNLKHLLLAHLHEYHDEPSYNVQRVMFWNTVKGPRFSESTFESSLVNNTLLEALADKTWTEATWSSEDDAAALLSQDDSPVSS